LKPGCTGRRKRGSIAGAHQPDWANHPRGRSGGLVGARAAAMLAKDILFGMKRLTLAGFILMGLTLTLNRMGQTGKALSIGLMTAGTALAFVGLYAGGGLW
jgi:hypothetical protein